VASTAAPTGMAVSDACEEFLADAAAQGLSEASIKKYRVLLVNARDPEEPK
jgi:hypothetical protein